MNKQTILLYLLASVATCASAVTLQHSFIMFSCSGITEVEYVEQFMHDVSTLIQGYNGQQSNNQFRNTKQELHNSIKASVIHREVDVLHEEVNNTVSTDQSIVNDHVYSLFRESKNELREWEVEKSWMLSIPSIDVYAPVYLASRKYWDTRSWDLLEQQMQIGLHHGTVAYPHSVHPDQKGSLIIAGHSSPPDELSERSPFGNILARLPEVSIGDEISVGTYTYTIIGKRVIDPTETTVLKQQDEERILKLITCFPIGSTKERLVVTAIISE